MSGPEATTVRRRIFADLRPLRGNPHFRRLWLGGAVSTLGGTLTNFALTLQVYRLTGSSAAVGAIAAASLVPTLVVGLLGGSLADAVDRRVLVLVTSSCLTLVSALLAVQAFLALDQLWLLYLLAAVQALLFSINGPARRAFLPRLLPDDQLAAATALNMSTFQASILIGPGLAGLITAVGGLRTCYLVDAISYFAALYSLARLPAMPPQGTIDRPGLCSVIDGFRFLRRRPILIGAMLADLDAMVLGMPLAVFPAINAAHFGGSAQTLGLLSTAVGAGGLLGSVLSGPLGAVRRPGRMMLVLIACWGAAIAGFGLTHVFWLALVLLAICGATDNTSVVLRMALVQRVTPDRYQGRINAVNFVVGFGGPQLGNVEAGVVGSLVSPVFSVVSGGLATVVGAALLRLVVPSLASYDTATPIEEEEENADAATG